MCIGLRILKDAMQQHFFRSKLYKKKQFSNETHWFTFVSIHCSWSAVFFFSFLDTQFSSISTDLYGYVFVYISMQSSRFCCSTHSFLPWNFLILFSRHLPCFLLHSPLFSPDSLGVLISILSGTNCQQTFSAIVFYIMRQFFRFYVFHCSWIPCSA